MNLKKIEATQDYMEAIWGEDELNQLCAPFLDLVISLMILDMTRRFTPRMAALMSIGILLDANEVLTQRVLADAATDARIH